MGAIQLIPVPYHYGFMRSHVGVGLGPARYLDAGAATRLGRRHKVTVNNIHLPAPVADETQAIIQISREIAFRVQQARDAAALPLVLGGGCSVCLGTLAALPHDDIGIIWFDAHGDFNTPETTPSGFFDGMPLAIATGRGFDNIRVAVSDRPSVTAENVVLAGVQNLDPGEADNLARSGAMLIPWAPWPQMQPAFITALEALLRRVTAVYVHFDIDVLDPTAAPSVDFREPDGLTVAAAAAALRLVGARFDVAAAALTAFNPEFDGRDVTEASGLALLDALAAFA